MFFAFVLLHQYSHNFLVGTCTGLYKPVQALKVESLQEKKAMSDFPQVLFSFRATSYDKPTRQQIKKLKSRDNHIKCVYYTHGPPSSSSPALVVATHHRRRHPPLSSSPALVVADRPHCCRPLLLSPPTIVVTLRCCCPPALIVAASASLPPSLRPALVVPAVRLLSSHLPLLLLPSLLLPLIGCLD